jgi:hypothetical protein
VTGGIVYGARRGEQSLTWPEGVQGEVDTDAARGRDVAQVGQQAVADVDHGRGAQVGGLGTGVVRRRGPQVRGHQVVVRQTGGKQGQPGRAGPERARDRDQVAGHRA